MSQLARVQHGVVARFQLLDEGFTRRQIDGKVAASFLMPVHLGVYAIGHDILTQLGEWQAAVFAAGRGAALSHTSASALWGMSYPVSRIEVMRPFGPDRPLVGLGNARSRRLTIHRSRAFEDREFDVCRGIKVTSVARTLLDRAGQASLRTLDSELLAAERQSLIVMTDLRRQMGRGRGWKGIGKLRQAVERWDPTALDSKSDLENKFLRFCHDRKLEVPVLNALVSGSEVDCFWPSHALVVELDSWKHHGGRSPFDRDRMKTLRMRNDKFNVISVTDRIIDENPDLLESTLRAEFSK